MQISPEFYVLFTDFSQHVDGAVQLCAIDISVSQLTLQFPRLYYDAALQPKEERPNAKATHEIGGSDDHNVLWQTPPPMDRRSIRVLGPYGARLRQAIGAIAAHA